MQINATARKIKNIEIKNKIVEDKEGERSIVTTVKFETESDPNEFIDVLQALAAHSPIDARFETTQLGFDMKPSNNVPVGVNK